MFKFSRALDGSVPTPRIITAGDGTYRIGTALYLTGGVAEIATGANVVAYISLENKTLAADGELMVYPVTPGMIFEAPISAYSSTTQKHGLTVTLHTDGEKVTATAPASGASAGGGAFIFDMQSAAVAGDKILVRLGFFH